MSTMDPSAVQWRKSTHSGHEGGQCVEIIRWRKSIRSGHQGGQCVEVARWRKSIRSGHEGGECVEVAFLTRIAVQDTPAANARA